MQDLPVIEVENLCFEEMKSYVGFITPEGAKSLLERNFANNRRLNGDRVRYWAALMEEGAWGLSQPINFSSDGQLIDGQHRLSAVVKVGTPQVFILMTGLPFESAQLVDQGVTRSAQHIAKIQGVNLSLSHISLIRYMIQSNSGSLLKEMPISPQVTVFAAQKYKSVLDFCLSSRSKSGSLNVAPVLAVVANAYFHENHKRLGEFLDCWRTGLVVTGAQDNAVLKLRSEYLLSYKKDRGGSTARASLFHKTQSALKHFLKGNNVSYLKETTDLVWKVPELDIKAIKAAKKQSRQQPDL